MNKNTKKTARKIAKKTTTKSVRKGAPRLGKVTKKNAKRGGRG